MEVMDCRLVLAESLRRGSREPTEPSFAGAPRVRAR
jgi:hypothetical protein